MKKRTLSLLMACALLIGSAVIMVFGVQEYEAIPSFIYDFSKPSITMDIIAAANMNYVVHEGEHTTFTASANDPALDLEYPRIHTSDAAYVRIEYRTTAQHMGEMYVARDDGVSVSQDPASHKEWVWEADGEWHTLILHCDAWADLNGVSFTQFRIDPLHSHSGVSAGDSIDIRYVALFDSEEKANAFDIAAFHTYEQQLEQDTQEKETIPQVEWPDPAYTEITPSADDNTPGTLSITYSEDGKYATISYGQGENAVSHTVPNNDINLFGGYAGTDDLDRSLFDASQVGVVTEDHDVGMFYFLWHGEHGDPGVQNMQQIIDQAGADAGNVNNPLWGKVHTWHWWNEPLYGYYYIEDEWVMRKHVELLINAGIDFLFFDTTNNAIYAQNALQLMSILHEFNEQGYDAPEVMFYTNTDAINRVRQIYDAIYAPGHYPDTWYMIDGKPAIVAPYEANVNDFFTVKLNQWPTEDPKENGWPWMDFEWPQTVYTDANGNPSAINVSVAQHSGSVIFSDSAIYGDTSNLGRSFNESRNNAISRSSYYKKLESDPELYLQGLNFQAQWDRAIEADVPFVLVTGWNEWIAQRQDYPDKIGFVDCASNEFSRDIEMMKGGYFDNYYVQLAYNVQRLKGTAPVIVQDARNAVNVTGSFEVWDKVLVTYTDPQGDNADRNASGFGDHHYTDTTGRNDIVASKVTADTKNLYFYVQTKDDLTMYDTDSTWMQLLLSTGGDGWYGYDYVVNYAAKDAFTTTVARYNGADGAYSYEVVGEVSYRVKGNEMMIAVPLEMLGITNPNGIKFDFKWADSDSKMTTMEQFYTEGDTAPLGRLNYTFQNCLDPEKAEQYVPTETETEAEQETSCEEEKTGGCKSALGGMMLLIGLAVIPCLVCKKKKN